MVDPTLRLGMLLSSGCPPWRFGNAVAWFVQGASSATMATARAHTLTVIAAMESPTASHSNVWGSSVLTLLEELGGETGVAGIRGGASHAML